MEQPVSLSLHNTSIASEDLKAHLFLMIFFFENEKSSIFLTANKVFSKYKIKQ
jgi:hypothetical protein